MTLLTGKEFRLLRAGSLKSLRMMIGLFRMLTPPSNNPFPVWQGMQYFSNMFEGRAKLNPLDNDRYPHIHWTRLGEFLNQTKSV